jgi:putative tricarboxylic transport membrane protein
VDFGRIVPSTVPSIAVWIMILTAALQFFATPEDLSTDLLTVVRAVLFIVLVVIAVWAMDVFGFEYIAPPFALIAMLMIGERRWHWLLVGSFVIPLGTWLIVERLLDRILA